MRSILVSISFLSAFAAAAAQATPITIEFAGAVHSVGSAVTGTIEVGDPVVGTLTYDAALAGPDRTPSSTAGTYFGAITHFGVTLGSYSAEYVSSGGLLVGNDQVVGSETRDQVLFGAALSGARINGHSLQGGQLGFSSDDPSRLSSDAIPTVSELLGFLASEADHNLNVITFDVAGATIEDDIRWNVSSFTAVPEPSTALLLGLGLLGLAVAGRPRASG